MKSYHSNFYLESGMLVSNTGVTEGILEDALCYLTVPYKIETLLIIITIHELEMEVETTPETSFELILS